MEDLLLFADALTDDERAVQASVAGFVDRDVIPNMAVAFDKGFFPHELIPACAKLGLFGLTLPTQYGGSGLNYVAYGLVNQELERADSALRSLVSVQSSLCMYPIYCYGSEAQKARWLPQMAAGEVIGCFGLTEPDAGSDPAGMRTVAEKTQGGWRINGSKLWITNAPIADLAIVWAKTDSGIRGFILEKEFPGFERHTIKQKMSLRISPTGELSMQDVFVPDENLLPGSDIGLKAALACLNQARFGISFGAMGAAIACFDATKRYLLERKQFNKPLAANQLIQNDLALMYTELLKAQWLNLRVGRLKDTNQATHEMVSLVKGNACREALAIARTCRNLLGANGISLDYPVIRHMLNLESVFTYEGTDNVHKLVLGKYLTGIQAFS